MNHRWMLASRSTNAATDPVLQSKLHDFSAVLGLDSLGLPNATVAKIFHLARKLPGGFGASGRILGRGNAGLFITFDIHTLKTQAPFFWRSGGDHALVLMDAWPANFDTVARWVQQYGIGDVFVSSSQARSELERRAPRVRWHWLPEGLPTDEYQPQRWEGRGIDVLSFGRKHLALHEVLKSGLPEAGVSYQFEPRPYEVLFPTQEEFLTGMGNAKISVCFPSSVTHPERSGTIETLTVRYLQSMASKCLILGQAPAELNELFGYEPVVAVDFNDPVAQIRAILAEPGHYIELVERNFATVYSAHTERHRAERLASTMNWNTVEAK